MRKIKFRAKTLANGHWVYGNLVIRDKECVSIRNSKSEPWVDSGTVGQFTGLYDCNRKEIYEGDIVRYIDANDEPKTSEVCFVDAAFSPLTEIMLMGDMECEVIGNIHDNSELLKGGKK